MAGLPRPSAASEILSLAVCVSGCLDEAGFRTRLSAVLPGLTGLAGLRLCDRASADGPERTFLAHGQMTVPALTRALPEVPRGVLHVAEAPPGLAPELRDALPALLGPAWAAARAVEARDHVLSDLQLTLRDRNRTLVIAEGRLTDLRAFQDEIVAALGHDLRSPIAILMGHCQLLEEGLIPPGQEARAYDTLRRQTERLGGMIDELLDRRRQRRTTVEALDPTDAAAMLDEVVQSLAGQAKQRGITVVATSAERARVSGCAAGVFREALASLLDEALRRIPSGGQLRLTLTPRGEELHIDIEPSAVQARPRVGADTTAPLRAVSRLLQAGGGRIEARGHPADYPLRVCVPAAGEDASTVLRLVAPDPARGLGLRDALSARWTVLDDPAGTRATPPGALAVVDLGGGAEPPAAGAWVAVVSATRPEAEAAAITAGACAVTRWPAEGPAVEQAVARSLRLVATAAATADRPDPVTGLPPPSWLAARLPPLLDEARAAAEPLAAVVIDVVALSEFNRVHGWALGDQLLAWLAVVVRDATGPGHVCARLGGDELIVLLPGALAEEANAISRRIVGATDHARPRLGLSRYPVKVRSITLDLTRLPIPLTISSILDAARGRGEVLYGA